MSNIRGGHKKLILEGNGDDFTTTPSFKYLSFLMFDGDIKILHRANGEWYKLSYDPDDKISAVATRHDRMYLVNYDFSTGDSTLSIIREYYGDENVAYATIEDYTSTTLRIISYMVHASNDTYDNLLTLLNINGSGVKLQAIVCNSVLATILYSNDIYTEVYDYRTVYATFNVVQSTDYETDQIITRLSHTYQTGISADDYVGIASSTVTSNVMIFTVKEEFLKNQDTHAGSPDIHAIAKLKVMLSLDGGSTLTDISNRLNTAYPLNNVTLVDGEYYLIDNTNAWESIYWMASDDGKLLCGIRPPYNKYYYSYGSSTAIYISTNYGTNFEDERIITIDSTVNTFFLPVCNNIGDNGNVLLGKYRDSFEDSHGYDDHLQLYVYNIFSGKLYDIADMLTLYDQSMNYYKPSTYRLSKDGNTVIVGGSLIKNITGSYRMVYFKLDISDIYSPRILDFSYYPNFISLTNYGVSQIITNF